MFTQGLKKQAAGKAGVLESVAKSARKAWRYSKPVLKDVGHHVSSKPGIGGAAAGAAGGAVAGAFGRDEYGQPAGMGGAIKGALLGGAAGAAGGGMYNKLKSVPAAAGKKKV